MTTLQFKTNINCGNCLRSVTPFLNEVNTVEQWRVDLQHPDRILTVEGDAVNPTDIINAVEDAGFDIQPLIMA